VKVRLTEAAEDDLEAIGDAIAKTDPARAVEAIKRLRVAARSIGRAPKLCPPLPWSAIPRLRKKHAGSYLLLFQLNGDEALVLRIAHERSDWVSLV
jgi:plasmid stabilization system protein ParE